MNNESLEAEGGSTGEVILKPYLMRWTGVESERDPDSV